MQVNDIPGALYIWGTLEDRLLIARKYIHVKHIQNGIRMLKAFSTSYFTGTMEDGCRNVAFHSPPIPFTDKALRGLHEAWLLHKSEGCQILQQCFSSKISVKGVLLFLGQTFSRCISSFYPDPCSQIIWIRAGIQMQPWSKKRSRGLAKQHLNCMQNIPNSIPSSFT